MRANSLLTATALASLVLTPLPAVADQFATGSARSDVTVGSTGPAQTWTGEVAQYGNDVVDVPECRDVYCDPVDITVDLPKSTWKRPGGLQIAIRWDGSTSGALGLVVYRGGDRVAKSITDMGTAQSVTIPRARNGKYRAYVLYGVTRGASSADVVIKYEGMAEVEFEPSAKPVRDLLPDLVALPQENVTYDRPPDYFDDFAAGGSCFYSERVEEGAEQCLRFDQSLKNGGTGPVEIRFDREAGVTVDEDVEQRIYRSDGSYYGVPSGQVEFHDIHGHYHFEGFAQSELWHLDEDGTLMSDEPSAVGDKVSFCITDTDLIDFGKKGDAPLTYPASDCLEPRASKGGMEYFWYGLSPGWADRYSWQIPDQMIDTAGLKDGRYALFTTVDPVNKLRESNESNNCSSVVVQLQNLDSFKPKARILGPGPKCQDVARRTHH